MSWHEVDLSAGTVWIKHPIIRVARTATDRFPVRKRNLTLAEGLAVAP